MNLPNKLTLVRIALTIVFMFFLFAHGFAIFLIGAGAVEEGDEARRCRIGAYAVASYTISIEDRNVARSTALYALDTLLKDLVDVEALGPNPIETVGNCK